MNLCSPDELLKVVQANLAKWDEAQQKITLFIAKDPWHPYEILTAGPHGLCIILCWDGSAPLGGDQADDLTLATQKVGVYLSFNLGLTANPSAALVEGNDNRPSLLALVSLLTRRMRSMDFSDEPDAAHYFRWVGTNPVTMPQGFPIAAYKLNFELDTDVEELQPQET